MPDPTGDTTPPLDLSISNADRVVGVEHWIRIAAWWNAECRKAWSQRQTLIDENTRLRAEVDTLTAKHAEFIEERAEAMARAYEAADVKIKALTTERDRLRADLSLCADALANSRETTAALSARLTEARRVSMGPVVTHSPPPTANNARRDAQEDR